MSVIVISGPTCAGKTSLERALHRVGMAPVVSHTTRQARPGEVDGQDYHFVTEEAFDGLLGAGGFVESVNFGKARYGKSFDALFSALAQGRHVATVLEPQGARALRRHCEHGGIPFMGVWIDCPPHVQAERFIRRSLSVEEASQRLGEMLSIEQDWQDWLRDGVLRCELRLSSACATPERLAYAVMEMLLHA